MNKLPGILIAIIAASMFYFPVEFAFLPGLNTKNLLAVVGAVALLLSFAGTAGSIALAWALWKFIQHKEGGKR